MYVCMHLAQWNSMCVYVCVCVWRPFTSSIYAAAAAKCRWFANLQMSSSSLIDAAEPTQNGLTFHYVTWVCGSRTLDDCHHPGDWLTDCETLWYRPYHTDTQTWQCPSSRGRPTGTALLTHDTAAYVIHTLPRPNPRPLVQPVLLVVTVNDFIRNQY